MSKPEVISIDGVDYTRSDLASNTIPEGDCRIVVLQRGWVVVGFLTTKNESGECVLEHSAVIRVWGTSKGLGELCPAPLAKTVLDKCGTVRFHYEAAVLMLDADDNGWKSALR